MVITAYPTGYAGYHRSVIRNTQQMTKVYGKIESLKKIRETLHQAGIDQFKSIADINEFNRDCNSELNTPKGDKIIFDYSNFCHGQYFSQIYAD